MSPAPSYSNGAVPESLLVIFKRGENARDGKWYHGFPPATYARHSALVRRAQLRTGRTLALNYGWTAYRPLWAQRMLKDYYTSIGTPNMAARPGTSSHGGFWEGRQTMAGDYSNWAWVYENHGGRAAFAADCRAVGAWPNMIVPARGYPDEPWHVVFPDPWGAVPAFDGVVLPFHPQRPPEEEDMGLTPEESHMLKWLYNSQIFFADAEKKVPQFAWSAATHGLLERLRPLIEDVQGRVRGVDPRGDMLQLLRADVAGIELDDVDEVSLARELAPLLPSLIATLPDAEVDRLAEAVADVQDERARKRLAE